jgi:hypothetical protein
MGLAVFLVAGALGAAGPARAAGPKAACAQSYERAQVARNSNKLQTARAELITCSQSDCPDFIQRDCVHWLAEVDAILPSVIVRAHDQGHPVSDVHVAIDGKEVVSKLDGGAIPLDPGEHTLRAERVGAPPVQQKILVTEGEKGRFVDVDFRPALPGVMPSTVETPPPHEPEPHRSLALPAVFGVVGALGIGTSVAFGLSAKSQADTLRTTCAPRCSDSDIGAVKTKLLVSDIGLGAGIVSLGLAAYFLFFANPSPHYGAARITPSGVAF